MWKIAVGFALFAALSIFVILKAGDKADMGGEKHGADAVHAPEPAAPAAPVAPASAQRWRRLTSPPLGGSKAKRPALHAREGLFYVGRFSV